MNTSRNFASVGKTSGNLPTTYGDTFGHRYTTLNSNLKNFLNICPDSTTKGPDRLIPGIEISIGEVLNKSL